MDDAYQPTLDAEAEPTLDDAQLRAALEAVLLVVDSPVTAQELASAVSSGNTTG